MPVRPLPALASQLAVDHQYEQQAVADKTAAGLALLWGILNFQDIDSSTAVWLHAVTLQVERQFRVSEQLAFDFVQGSKWAVEPLSDPLVKVSTVFPERDFQLAMRATGPATVKRATQRAFAAPVRDSGTLSPSLPLEVPKPDVSAVERDVMALGKLTSTGAAVQYTLNGGRGEVQHLVLADAKTRKSPIGWARFTEDSANGPCYFCALLASQGAVYVGGKSFDRSNKAFTGDGVAKVHDHCECSLRPVYRERDSMDARAKFFLRQWTNSNGDMKLFRKAYRKPPSYAARPINIEDVRRNRDLVAAELGRNSIQARWWDSRLKALTA